MAQLFIKDSDGTPTAYLVEGLCKIGRHPDSAVLIDHASVSGHHAELWLQNGVYLLKDLLSSNGTYVNGEKIMIHQLKDGDQIRFGKVDAAISIEISATDPASDPHPPPLLGGAEG